MQSVVLGSTLFVVAVQLAALGIIGDLLAANRVLMQRTLERVRRIELTLGVAAVPLRAGRGRQGRSHADPRRRRDHDHAGHASHGVPPDEPSSDDTEEHALPLGGRS